MTILDFATQLNGRQYLNEITMDELLEAEELGYIVVFGQSDDLCEIRGKVNEEYDCYHGATINDDRLPKPIEVFWCEPERNMVPWTYKTDMPHAEFTIYDGDELYCIGLVIDLNAVIKSCPCCGGEATIRKINKTRNHRFMYKISCVECQLSTPPCYDMKSAREIWNRRC